MIRNKKFFLKHVSADLGGGGWFCACCAPGSRGSRKKIIRRMKKKVNRILDKIESQDLE